MPNWCAGDLRVRGTKENLIKFLLDGLNPIKNICNELEPLKINKNGEICGDTCHIKGTHNCLDYIERKAKSMDKKLREYKSIFEEEHPLDGNSFNFLHFNPYSKSTLKRMTKGELIDHINILYINWKNADNTCERISRLAKQLYEKLEHKRSLKNLEDKENE